MTRGIVPLVVFAGVAAYPAAVATRLSELVTGIGVAAFALFAVGLVTSFPAAVVTSIVAFGAEYSVYLRVRGSVDSRAVFVAAALVLVSELAFSAIAPATTRTERSVVVRAIASLAIVVVSAAVVAGIVLVASGSVPSGLGFEVAGMLAALVVVASVVWLASRSRESTST